MPHRLIYEFIVLQLTCGRQPYPSYGAMFLNVIQVLRMVWEKNWSAVWFSAVQANECWAQAILCDIFFNMHIPLNSEANIHTLAVEPWRRVVCFNLTWCMLSCFETYWNVFAMCSIKIPLCARCRSLHMCDETRCPCHKRIQWNMLKKHLDPQCSLCLSISLLSSIMRGYRWEVYQDITERHGSSAVRWGQGSFMQTVCHYPRKFSVKMFVFVRDPLSLHIGDKTRCPCQMELTWTKPSRTSFLFQVSNQWCPSSIPRSSKMVFEIYINFCETTAWCLSKCYTWAGLHSPVLMQRFQIELSPSQLCRVLANRTSFRALWLWCLDFCIKGIVPDSFSVFLELWL